MVPADRGPDDVAGEVAAALVTEALGDLVHVVDELRRCLGELVLAQQADDLANVESVAQLIVRQVQQAAELLVRHAPSSVQRVDALAQRLVDCSQLPSVLLLPVLEIEHHELHDVGFSAVVSDFHQSTSALDDLAALVLAAGAVPAWKLGEGLQVSETIVSVPDVSPIVVSDRLERARRHAACSRVHDVHVSTGDVLDGQQDAEENHVPVVRAVHARSVVVRDVHDRAVTDSLGQVDPVNVGGVAGEPALHDSHDGLPAVHACSGELPSAHRLARAARYSRLAGGAAGRGMELSVAGLHGLSEGSPVHDAEPGHACVRCSLLQVLSVLAVQGSPVHASAQIADPGRRALACAQAHIGSKRAELLTVVAEVLVCYDYKALVARQLAGHVALPEHGVRLHPIDAWRGHGLQRLRVEGSALRLEEGLAVDLVEEPLR